MVLTELPIYLIHNKELPHRGDGALFHYTKFENLQKILTCLDLKSSSFSNLNDMNEACIHNMDMNKNFMVMKNAERYIKEKCHIICFSQNYDINGFGIEGTNHPAMWAHYADNSRGSCIVIDKNAFVQKNKEILDNYFYKFEDVTYSRTSAPKENSVNYDVETPEDFIKENWASLFFLKHNDWANEDEHRLFIMDYDGKFSIDGCIKYIVLGRKLFLDKAKTKQIIDMVVNPELLCYHKFVPHSFAASNYGVHGYQTLEIAPWIHSIVKANLADPRYLEYERWLQDEQGYP